MRLGFKKRPLTAMEQSTLSWYYQKDERMILDARTQVEETPHLHGSVVAHRTEQVDFVLVSFFSIALQIPQSETCKDDLFEVIGKAA